jgi:SAM-dependent methyltransferase
MDLPGIGRVGQEWDLRPTIDAYLGGFDFRGKRVLDVGAASGFLTFEMEKRGARVVSFDLGEEMDWDRLPCGADSRADQARALKRQSHERLLNAYWLAHRLLGSTARAFYGNIYALPEALGAFDAVVLGSVLLHLRDPFLALQSASRLSREAVIITDLRFDAPTPVMEFLPNPEVSPDIWWRISVRCMAAMLAAVGFNPPTITCSEHLAVHQGVNHPIPMSTYVARRPSRR